MKPFIPILLLILFQSTLLAQEGSSFNTSFEVQAAVSYVDLLGGKASLLDSDLTGIYNYKISRYDQKGAKLQIGALATRQIGTSLWFRSGIQLFSLTSKADFSTEETYDDAIDSYINTNDRVVELSFLGMQVPLMLEQQYDFGKWKAYGNLGLNFSYGSVRVENSEDIIEHFFFSYVYDPSCACFPTGNAQPRDPPNTWKGSYSKKVQQFSAAGILGIGGIIKGDRGKAYRIGYALIIETDPFHEGNNTRERIYEIFEQKKADHRHLFHQIELSMVWPEQTIDFNTENGKSYFKGWFVGVSSSLQLPTKNKSYSGRTGIGWGRNVQVKYISKIGWGGRLQYGRWIAPESNYATRSRITKGELLYQLPFGVEFSTGYSRRLEYDVDGGGGTARAFLFGTGGTIPLNKRMGLMIDLSGHYLPWERGEKLLMEAGFGFVFRVLN